MRSVERWAIVVEVTVHGTELQVFGLGVGVTPEGANIHLLVQHGFPFLSVDRL